MRKFLIAAAALGLCTPVAAQPPVHHHLPDEIAPAVPDGRDIAGMAHMMDRLVGAVLDLPVGGIVEAVDPQGRGYYRPGDTLRDMATRDDPYAEERLRGSIYGTTAGMGAMIDTIAVLAPVLRHTIEQAQRDIDEAMHREPYHRD